MRQVQFGGVTIYSDEDEKVWATLAFATDDSYVRYERGEISYSVLKGLRHLQECERSIAELMLGRPVDG